MKTTIAIAPLWNRLTVRGFAVCVAFCASVLLLSGCAADQPVSNAEPGDGSPTTGRTTTIENVARLDGKATVEVVTNRGSVTVELYGDEAPVTAGNFVDLVQREVYDGTVFHRVVREPEPFVVQGGDPMSKDAGVPASMLGRGSFTDPDTGNARYVPLEILPEGEAEPVYGQTLRNAAPELKHTRGAIAMARSQAPDSASAQFYFTLADLAFLDGNYAVFGYVTEGMDVVDAIQQGDTIESIRVIDGLDNFSAP
jgi:peptidyl-prolyl cis-trans isomerase B (cyclophilin B)